MLLHCLLIHLKQSISYLYRDGLDINMINLQVFCLLASSAPEDPSLQWEASWNSTSASLAREVHPSSHISLSKQGADRCL